MQGLGVEAATALQCLAVDCNMARLAAFMCKRAECLGQDIAVERLENIVIRGVTRCAVDAE